MDDGHINIRKDKSGRPMGFYIKISTCTTEEQVQLIIDYFKEKWGISFYKIKEHRKYYSLCCGTKEGMKFIELVKPYVEQVPSMIHKITYDLSQRKRMLTSTPEMVEMGNTLENGVKI